jgi:phage shock protein C
MQPRLTRSRTEVVVAGVCGGLAEYFHIDPVIVRLLFVLVTLTSGIGIIAYPLLWIVIPKAPAPDDPAADPGATGTQSALPSQQQSSAIWEPQATRLREPARQRPAGSAAWSGYADQPPPPEEYRFDPLTGEPIRRDQPAMGATTDLSRHPAAQAAAQANAPTAAPAPQRGRARVSWAGVILLGLGVMMLADQIGIEPDIMFPVLMVVVGAMLLFRRA